MDTKLIEIFCIFDEFCKFFNPKLKECMISPTGKRTRNRKSVMSDSETMTIMMMYHQSRTIGLKSFYLGEICMLHKVDFPKRLSYNRFVERQQKVGMLLLLFLQTCALGNALAYPSSTPRRYAHAISNARTGTRL